MLVDCDVLPVVFLGQALIVGPEPNMIPGPLVEWGSILLHRVPPEEWLKRHMIVYSTGRATLQVSLRRKAQVVVSFRKRFREPADLSIGTCGVPVG